MGLVVEQALLCFAPGTAHLDYLLLDQHFWLALFDIGDRNLRS